MSPHAPYTQRWREWSSTEVTKITKSPEITRETANLFDSQNFSMLGIKCVNGLGLLFAGTYTFTRDIMTTVENLAQGAVPSKKRTDNSEVKFSKNSDSLHH